MPRMDKLSSYATTIATRNGNTCITYHNTCIVEFDHENIILRTGGWDSVTTRRKMNQAAKQFSLGFSVYREDGVSYVYTDNGATELEEIMAIDRHTMKITSV